MTGRKLEEGEVKQSSLIGINLPTGIYQVVVTYDGRQKSFKLTKV